MSRAPHSQNVHPTVIKQHYEIQNVWAFENDWNIKLVHKIDGRCCFSCFCSCCMGCKLASHLGEATIIGCFPCSLCYLRTKLRTARRIKGDCCSDCCASCFPCCIAFNQSQMASELELQGMWDAPKPTKSKQMVTNRSNQYNDFN